MIMLSVFGVPVEGFTTGHNCVAIKLSNTSVAILAESVQDFKLTLDQACTGKSCWPRHVASRRGMIFFCRKCYNYKDFSFQDLTEISAREV